MSKWGTEEQATIDKIKEIDFKGKILNLAAGDGRFNEMILNLADKVVAVDIDKEELKELENNCPKNLKNKLEISCIDITKKLPFEQNTFDGVFCTGTLHLFDEDIINNILLEIERVLKHKGKILFDFATDILRFDANNKQIIFNGEGNYKTEEAIKLFQRKLKNFTFNIEKNEFKEENLDSKAGYKFIKGNFLIISGLLNKNNF